MASPQPDKFTKVSNELLEAIIRTDLSGAQLRALLFVVRKTYGYRKKMDKISLSQFAGALGMRRANIPRVLDSLVSRNIIKKNDSSYIITYGLQKNYENWRGKTVIQTDNTLQTVINLEPTVLKNDNKSAINTDNNKRKKDNIQKKVVGSTPSTEKVLTKKQEAIQRFNKWLKSGDNWKNLQQTVAELQGLQGLYGEKLSDDQYKWLHSQVKEMRAKISGDPKYSKYQNWGKFASTWIIYANQNKIEKNKKDLIYKMRTPLTGEQEKKLEADKIKKKREED